KRNLVDNGGDANDRHETMKKVRNKIGKIVAKQRRRFLLWLPFHSFHWCQDIFLIGLIDFLFWVPHALLYFPLYSLYGKPTTWNLQGLQIYFQTIIATKDFVTFVYCLSFVTSHLCLKSG
ncbi:hypothetical protein S83_059812, partial [Arachis hypogaea]